MTHISCYRLQCDEKIKKKKESCGGVTIMDTNICMDGTRLGSDIICTSTLLTCLRWKAV